MKKIILTGGGTAGHVTPNIAMIPRLKEMGYEISYIGTYNGIEKLRRYFDLKNFTDPFRVNKGFGDAKKILKQIKPDVVFSKGGFVTVPVVLMAAHLKIPVVIHESDMTPGLANKIALPKATKICCNFPETKELFSDRTTVTGTPIRQELFNGDKEKAREFCGFTDDKPVVMVVGGSTGSVAVNKAIWGCLDELLETFNVIHLTGKGKTNPDIKDKAGYVQYEFIKEQLADMFALADVVISRAGANAICELLAIRKPNLLIPLSKAASRGDQILNAQSFEKSGYSYVIEEEAVSNETLLSGIKEVYENREKYIEAMQTSELADSITSITSIIDSLV